jgi:hypothetical protein
VGHGTSPVVDTHSIGVYETGRQVYIMPDESTRIS